MLFVDTHATDDSSGDSSSDDDEEPTNQDVNEVSVVTSQPGSIPAVDLHVNCLLLIHGWI